MRLQELIEPEVGVGQTVYWKKTGKPGVTGSWATRYRLVDSPDASANVNLEIFDSLREDEVLHYLKSASQVMNANFGFLDSLNRNEDQYLAFLREAEAVPYGTDYIVTSHVLRNWLPDMFWASVFGPPYVRMFGLDRLMSTPAFRVERLGPEMVFVQLTESIEDVHSNFEDVQSVRRLAKAHLGQGSFYIQARHYDWRRNPELAGTIFRVPEFPELKIATRAGP